MRAANSYPLQPLPDYEIHIVEKEIPSHSSTCSSRNIRGRLVILHNPLGHFDIVEPLGGCTRGQLSLPSLAGKKFRPINYSNGNKQVSRKPFWYHELVANKNLSIWKSEFDKTGGSCLVVTNAGFVLHMSSQCIPQVDMLKELSRHDHYPHYYQLEEII